MTAVTELNSTTVAQSARAVPTAARTVGDDTSIASNDAVQVAVDSTTSSRAPASQSSERVNINKAIEATNLALNATDEIGRIVGSIEGIVEQAQDPGLSSDRLAILEKEAEGLRKEIGRAAQSTTSSGVKPLAGDPIRVEVERTLGKALEIILPDVAAGSLGLNTIRLSPKDVIINTITSIEHARKGIEDLRAHLANGVGTLKDTVTALEVARENGEASQTSLRDVEDALHLAVDTRKGIRGDPKGALDSVGNFRSTQELLDL